MKKILLTGLILFLLTNTNIFAMQSHDGPLVDEADFFGFNITIEPSFGYLLGQAREIVYVHSLSSTYLSELIWELKNILYSGASGSINIRNRLYINIGFWTAVYGGNGEMMDFDWIYTDSSGNPTNYPENDGYERFDWTHWSLSSVKIVDSYIFDTNISYDFLSNREFKFSVIGGYKSLYWDWTDSVLDSLYPSGPDVLVVGSDAIDYKLGLDIFYLGLGGAVYSHGFIFDGKIIYSPIVFGGDHDHHIQRDTFPDGSPTYGGIHFYDKIIFGQYAAFSIKIGYAFSKHFALSTQVSGEYLFEKRGDTYVYDNLDTYKGKDAGGAGIQYQSISFSINAAVSF